MKLRFEHEKAGSARRIRMYLVNGFMVAALLLALSCNRKKKEIEPEPKPTTLTKDEFLARLFVQERFWRIEEISKEVDGEVTVMDVRQVSPLPEYFVDNLIPFLAIQFSRGSHGAGSLREVKMTGAYGKVPFGRSEFELDLYGASVGGWMWNDEKEVLSFNLPVNLLSIAFWLANGARIAEKAIVAAEPTPMFRGMEEARAAATPERIRIIIEEASGKEVYVFTMRAAWMTNVKSLNEVRKQGTVIY